MSTPEERAYCFMNENRQQLQGKTLDDIVALACMAEHEATKTIIIEKTKTLFRPDRGMWP